MAIILKSDSVFDIKEGRINITWEPKGWPAGLVTGYFKRISQDNDTFFIEHVIVFASATVPYMIKHCLRKAKEIQLNFLEFEIPKDFAWYSEICHLAKRVGFFELSDTETGTYFRKVL